MIVAASKPAALIQFAQHLPELIRARRGHGDYQLDFVFKRGETRSCYSVLFGERWAKLREDSPNILGKIGLRIERTLSYEEHTKSYAMLS